MPAREKYAVTVSASHLSSFPHCFTDIWNLSYVYTTNKAASYYSGC
jgi:hypothetical protein